MMYRCIYYHCKTLVTSPQLVRWWNFDFLGLMVFAEHPDVIIRGFESVSILVEREPLLFRYSIEYVLCPIWVGFTVIVISHRLYCCDWGKRRKGEEKDWKGSITSMLDRLGIHCCGRNSMTIRVSCAVKGWADEGWTLDIVFGLISQWTRDGDSGWMY